MLVDFFFVLRNFFFVSSGCVDGNGRMKLKFLLSWLVVLYFFGAGKVSIYCMFIFTNPEVVENTRKSVEPQLEQFFCSNTCVMMSCTFSCKKGELVVK